MNKTTTTMLMAAGLIALAGCKSDKVMDDRHFPQPKEDPVAVQPEKVQPMTPVENEGKANQGFAPQKGSKAAPGYRPMEGAYGDEGIDDNAAPRRRGKKASKAAPKSAGKGGVYIVKKGDTLGRIAYRHKVSINALRQANNLTPEKDRFLRVGAKLTIPAGGKYVAPAGKKGVKSAAPAPRSGKKTPKLNADGTYTMVKGDNIPKIARKFGIRARALQAANNLSDEDTTKLQIGRKLTIPTGDDAKAGSRKVPVKKVTRVEKSVEKQPVADQSANPASQTPVMPPEAAVESTTPVLPPAENSESASAAAPAPVPTEAVPAESSTDFVSVTGFNSLEEFAAKYNTTVDEIIRLNPRIDRNAPIASFGMLYVPRAAK